MAFSFGTPAATTAPVAPTFSFGTPAATTSTPATSSLFGAAPTSTTSFGNPASTAAPLGGLFGASQQQQQQQPATSTGGGLFGATSQASSLFGGATTSQPTSTPSLFGNSSAAQTTPSFFGGAASQAPTTGGLFGQPAAITSSAPSLFGNTGTSTPLFGAATPASTQPAGTTSLFGGASSSLFGQQPQQQQAQQPAVTAAPLFGQSQSAATSSLFSAKPASSSLFGVESTLSNNNSQMIANPGSQQSQQLQQLGSSNIPKLGDPPLASPNEPSIEARLQAIKSAWDPADPACRFQTYFYNEVKEPNKVSMYGRPPNGTNEQAWRKAVRENPDPERLVPAIAIGFPAIQTRLESQSRQSTAHQNTLSEIHAHLSTLSSTHALETSLRTLRAQQTAQALAARLLALVSKVGPLSSSRNASVRREEDELRVRVERMSHEVKKLKTRGNELWSGVGALKARDHGLGPNDGGGGSSGGGEWSVVEDEGLRQVLEILGSQQAGLDHLSKTVDKADADVEVIKQAFGLSNRPIGGSGSGSANKGLGGHMYSQVGR